MTEQELAKLMIGSDLPEIMPRPEIKPHPGLEVCFKVKRLALRAATRSTARLTFPVAESSAWPVSPETARQSL